MSLYDEDRFQIAVAIVVFLSVFFLFNRFYALAYKLNMIRIAPQRAEMLFFIARMSPLGRGPWTTYCITWLAYLVNGILLPIFHSVLIIPITSQLVGAIYHAISDLHYADTAGCAEVAANATRAAAVNATPTAASSLQKLGPHVALAAGVCLVVYIMLVVRCECIQGQLEHLDASKLIVFGWAANDSLDEAYQNTHSLSQRSPSHQTIFLFFKLAFVLMQGLAVLGPGWQLLGLMILSICMLGLNCLSPGYHSRRMNAVHACFLSLLVWATAAGNLQYHAAACQVDAGDSHQDSTLREFGSGDVLLMGSIRSVKQSMEKALCAALKDDESGGSAWVRLVQKYPEIMIFPVVMGGASESASVTTILTPRT